MEQDVAGETTEIILKATTLMRERSEEDMAVAMTLEQGKPIAAVADLEVLRACEIIEWDASEGRRVYGRVIPGEPGIKHGAAATDRCRRGILAVEFFR